MNWYKKAQHGEWWIIDGEAIFADSDTGDIGHEAYVIDNLRREIAETIGRWEIDEYYEWEEVKQQLVKNHFEKLDDKQKKRMLKDWLVTDEQELIGKVPYETDIFDNLAKGNGITELQLNVAENRVDARDYGMKELGWQRVAGNSIQTWTLTTDDLHHISNGIDDILGDWEDNSDPKFTIEVGSTQKLYFDVPSSVIETLSPKKVAEYGGAYSPYAYAENLNWYKKAQIIDVPEYLYHGTSEGAFRNIRKNGLVPPYGKFIYFSDTEEYAQTYSQRKGNSYGDRILRVKKTKDIIPDANTNYQGDFKTNRAIPPQNIEVKINNDWVPIQIYSNEDIGILPYELV